MNTPGRYQLKVYGPLAKRLEGHHCDGTYDAAYDVAMAVSGAICDDAVTRVEVICPDRSKPKIEESP